MFLVQIFDGLPLQSAYNFHGHSFPRALYSVHPVCTPRGVVTKKSRNGLHLHHIRYPLYLFRSSAFSPELSFLFSTEGMLFN